MVRRKAVRALECRGCGVEKPLTDSFWHRNGESTTGFQRRCKVCMIVAVRRNHGKHVARIRALKESVPCADCGVAHPFYVMQFDHRDGTAKTGDISKMMYGSYSWRTLVAEIAKCDLVCANCHARRTWMRANSPASGGTAG